jgi:hypothetical protein
MKTVHHLDFVGCAEEKGHWLLGIDNAQPASRWEQLCALTTERSKKQCIWLICQDSCTKNTEGDTLVLPGDESPQDVDQKEVKIDGDQAGCQSWHVPFCQSTKIHSTGNLNMNSTGFVQPETRLIHFPRSSIRYLS